jgi:hopanoid biosynthesis associated RND transporter like protein HpnN
VVASLLTLVVGLILTAAFATMAIGYLNMISVAFGILYIGLGVDYAIHLALRVREAVLGGRTVKEAVVVAASDVGGSLVLCTVTTAIGFFAFVPTAYRGVSQLGLIAGAGMFISLFVSLTVMPALLVAIPVRASSLVRRGRVAGLLGRLADLPVEHRRGVLAVAALLAIGSLALLPYARFDTNPINLRDPDAESVRTFRDLLETSDTPPWSATVLADDLASVRDLGTALEALDTVDMVVSIESFVPADQEAKRLILDDLALTLGPGLLDIHTVDPPTLDEQRETVRRLGETLREYGASGRGGEVASSLTARLAWLDRALGAPSGAEVARAVEQGLLGTLPPNLALLDQALEASPFTEADLPEALARRWRCAGSCYRLEAFSRQNLDDMDALEAFVASLRDVAPQATGAPVMIVESGNAIVSAFRQALIVSILACTAVLFVLLRRPLDVLLVLVPLLFAGLLTGAATVLLGVPFNFANVIAIPLLFGIGVDSGIHVVHRGRGVLPPDAHGNPVRTSTGRAVVFSALTTIGSFGNLALSAHPGTASMGLLLAVGVTLTLLATIVLLPALAFGRRGATVA